MISAALTNASIVALVSMFMGIVPLGTGVVYAIWPSEQRLMLMRPLSLATIFAAISGSVLGVLNVFLGMGTSDPPAFSRVVAIGLSESLVPHLLRLRVPDGRVALCGVRALAASLTLPLHVIRQSVTCGRPGASETGRGRKG
jgi:hypothetical protein